MEYECIQKKEQLVIWLHKPGRLVANAQDALDLVVACSQENSRLLMVDGDRLSGEFLKLSTGVAGDVAQKLSQYGVKTAIVLDTKRVHGKFVDFVLETNRGNSFRAYPTHEEALAWLVRAP